MSEEYKEDLTENFDKGFFGKHFSDFGDYVDSDEVLDQDMSLVCMSEAIRENTDNSSQVTNVLNILKRNNFWDFLPFQYTYGRNKFFCIDFESGNHSEISLNMKIKEFDNESDKVSFVPVKPEDNNIDSVLFNNIFSELNNMTEFCCNKDDRESFILDCLSEYNKITLRSGMNVFLTGDQNTYDIVSSFNKKLSSYYLKGLDRNIGFYSGESFVDSSIFVNISDIFFEDNEVDSFEFCYCVPDQKKIVNIKF